jgi:hypothetical protein
VNGLDNLMDILPLVALVKLGSANGNFKRTKDGIDAKWDFMFCPYCGKEIKVVTTDTN